MRFFIRTADFLRQLRPIVQGATNCISEHPGENRLTLEATEQGLFAHSNGGHIAVSSPIEAGTIVGTGVFTGDAVGLCQQLATFTRHEVMRFYTTGRSSPGDLVLTPLDDRMRFSTIEGDKSPPLIPTPSVEQAVLFRIRREEMLRILSPLRRIWRRPAPFKKYKPRPHETHWLLSTSQGRYRAFSGNGQVYVCVEKEGRSVVTASQPHRLCVDYQLTPALTAVINSMSGEELTVRHRQRGEVDILELDDGKVVAQVPDWSASQAWPDETWPLKLKSHCRFTLAAEYVDDFRRVIQRCHAQNRSAARESGHPIPLRDENVVLRLPPGQRFLYMHVGEPLRRTHFVPLLDLQADEVPEGFRYEVNISALLEGLRRAGDNIVQFDVRQGKQTIVAMHLNADALVQDEVWQRDYAAMTRQREIVFMTAMEPIITQEAKQS